MKLKRYFVAYYYFIQFDYISLGIHFYLSGPNIEIHLPFGFIRIGWMHQFENEKLFGFRKSPLPLWGCKK